MGEVKKLSAEHLKKIWATANEIHISKEQLKQIVFESVKEDSISNLTPGKAVLVVARLNELRNEYFSNRKKSKLELLRYKLQKRSYSQLIKAKEICNEIKKAGKEFDLDQFAQRQYSKPFDLLTRAQAAKLIQALLVIQSRLLSNF
ncbi:phage protein GemA/Gp16 family protein [Leptospira abararensis]|uniref:phage protein GemA/Gp16 family protein n=1 Tax=Leptospira abararensis TaxID=2810036 RepID=UPI00196297D4|nr:phage protein GemA/Gp16 family protein [Leptospira abararensis]